MCTHTPQPTDNVATNARTCMNAQTNCSRSRHTRHVEALRPRCRRLRACSWRCIEHDGRTLEHGPPHLKRGGQCLQDGSHVGRHVPLRLTLLQQGGSRAARRFLHAGKGGEGAYQGVDELDGGGSSQSIPGARLPRCTPMQALGSAEGRQASPAPVARRAQGGAGSGEGGREPTCTRRLWSSSRSHTPCTTASSSPRCPPSARSSSHLE